MWGSSGQCVGGNAEGNAGAVVSVGLESLEQWSVSGWKRWWKRWSSGQCVGGNAGGNTGAVVRERVETLE